MGMKESIRWHLNLLDRWWGVRFYDYETVAEDVLLIELNQFPGDEYMVEFQVQRVTQARRGPWFIRRVKDHGYVAEWSIPKDGAPILLDRNVGSYGSSVNIPDPVDWRMDADDALKAWVLDQRRQHGFHIPEDKGMTTTTLDNEELKAQYTPAELAQQAINRDADPRTFFEQLADVQEIVDKANRKKED